MYIYDEIGDWIQQCPISISSHDSRDQGTKHNHLRSVSYKVYMCYLVFFPCARLLLIIYIFKFVLR